jgi:hypothetical protein
MNERLQELMLQAGYTDPKTASRARILSRLIIQDCANVVFEYGGGTIENDGTLWNESTAIEKHFGLL